MRQTRPIEAARMTRAEEVAIARVMSNVSRSAIQRTDACTRMVEEGKKTTKGGGLEVNAFHPGFRTEAPKDAASIASDR